MARMARHQADQLGQHLASLHLRTTQHWWITRKITEGAMLQEDVVLLFTSCTHRRARLLGPLRRGLAALLVMVGRSRLQRGRGGGAAGTRCPADTPGAGGHPRARPNTAWWGCSWPHRQTRTRTCCWYLWILWKYYEHIMIILNIQMTTL